MSNLEGNCKQAYDSQRKDDPHVKLTTAHNDKVSGGGDKERA